MSNQNLWFTSFRDFKSLTFYILVFYFVFPLVQLAISIGISYVGYIVLHLKKVISFRKIIFWQMAALILREVVYSLFDSSKIFVFPLQLRSVGNYRSWSIIFTHLNDPFGLINWGYVVHIPYYWLFLNIFVNLVPIVYFYFALNKYSSLTIKKRYLFLLILAVSTFSISFIIR